MSTLSISVLGPLHITLDGQPVQRFEYNKVRALLVYLAVEAQRPHTREALMALFWPDLNEPSARMNLRQTLATLRRALGDEQNEPPFLLASRESIQFNRAGDYRLDFATLVDLLDAADNHPHRGESHGLTCRACMESLQTAVEGYPGEFLADFSLPDSAAFEEWALLKREWLHRRIDQAAGRLVAFYERRGDYARALAFARRSLDLDPWREESHRQVMRLLLLNGERSAALVQFERCRAALAEALGVEPEAETVRLYEQIRDQPAAGHTAASLFAAPARRPHSLPPQVTPFIGREKELDEIGRLLDNPEVRLVSLLGMGGSGKTRLAIQAAAEQLDAFRDGVYFVSLAAPGPAEALVQAIAEVTGCEMGGAGGGVQQLCRCLRDREMLLVLDNMEYLLDGPEMLVALLRAAPELTLLATSRERLNLPGEWVTSVDGLALPEPAADADTTGGLEALRSSEAVRLFLQSAARAQAGFDLTEQNAPGIARICRLVSGLPLALELAAAWVRVLSCAEIAGEIEHSLGFLASTERGIPERQRSLTVVLDHSWALLSPSEQAVMRRLGVFRGGFSREAAHQAAGADLNTLAALVDKSLVQRSPSGRYAVHPLLRQYALEQNTPDESAGARSQHAAYYLEMAETAARQDPGGYQKDWLPRLETEHDNLRAALEWSLLERAGEPGARLAAALYRFWYWHSYFAEGLYWLKTALALPGKTGLSVQADAAYAAGVLASEQGDYAQARAFLERALALRRALDDRRGMAHALNSLGLIAWSQEDYARAYPLLEESLAQRRALGDQGASLARPLNSLGLVLLAQGQAESARAYFAESLALSRADGDAMGIAASLSNLGAALLDLDRPTEALTCLRDGLAGFQAVGDKEGLAWGLEGAAAARIALGEADTGARLLGAAAALRETINAPLTPVELARVRLALEAARALLGESAAEAALAQGRGMDPEQAVAEICRG